MAVLLKDVAKYASTSPSTVSQVLNGRPTSIRVSESTRKRVLRAADILGYRPNPIAQSLRTQRTATIGVVFQGLTTNAARIQELQIKANAAGYQLLLAVSGDRAASQEHEVTRLLHHKVDGLAILSPSLEAASQPTLSSLVRQKFPVVGIGPMLIEGADLVDWDRIAAYRQITEHLLKRGCRHLLFAGHAETPGVHRRVDGVRAAIAAAGHGQLRLLRAGTDIGKALEQQIRGGWPHAVICSTDQLAATALQAAAAVGRTVPNDLAVTGCSDLEFSELLTVPLTTIRMPHVELANKALSRLIDRIERPIEVDEPLNAIVPAEVIIRKSSNYSATVSSK